MDCTADSLRDGGVAAITASCLLLFLRLLLLFRFVGLADVLTRILTEKVVVVVGRGANRTLDFVFFFFFFLELFFRLLLLVVLEGLLMLSVATFFTID
jgi:hypothetical protein